MQSVADGHGLGCFWCCQHCPLGTDNWRLGCLKVLLHEARGKWRLMQP